MVLEQLCWQGCISSNRLEVEAKALCVFLFRLSVSCRSVDEPLSCHASLSWVIVYLTYDPRGITSDKPALCQFGAIPGFLAIIQRIVLSLWEFAGAVPFN